MARSLKKGPFADQSLLKKVDAMNEAYNNRKPVANTRNTYEGITKEGIIMEMYIDENTKQVISSFPKF